MGNIFLHAFITKVRESRRLLYGDLQRLQRDVLPNGPATREEAEALIGLDGALERADEGWPGYLETVLKEFVLVTSRGSIDRELAEWFVSAATALPAKTSVAITREVVKEARHTDQVLLDFVKTGAKRVKEETKTRPAMACSRSRDECLTVWPEQIYELGPIAIPICNGTPCPMEFRSGSAHQEEQPASETEINLNMDG